MIGVEKARLKDTLDIIKAKSRRKAVTVASPSVPGSGDGSAPIPIQVTVGGATVFIVDVEAFHKF